MESEKTKKPVLLDLNFVPTWARQPPGTNPYHGADYAEDDRPSHRRRPRERRPGEGRHGSAESRQRQPARSRGEPRRAFDRPGRREERRDERGYASGTARERRPPPPPPAPDLQADVYFIPEKQRLGAVVRKIRDTNRAYPLMEVAGLFLNNPDSYMIKLEAHREEAGGSSVHFFQCEVCKAVYLAGEDVLEHLLSDHLDAFFEAQDVEVEAPAGQFVCVGKCGLSGELVGPPNYHGFEDRIRTLQRERFPAMSYDEYRSRIELIHDADVIEQWKQQMCRQRRYRPIAQEAPDAEGAVVMLTQDEAREALRKRFGETCRAGGQGRVMIPCGMGRTAGDPAVRRAMRRAWNRESRQPRTLAIALRPAFKHMGLHLFKAGEGITFVTHVKPHPLDPGHVIDSIREVLTHLHDHPGCTRRSLVEQLRPGGDSNAQAVGEVLTPLRWLIERGHVIEFFNGTLSVPVSRSKAQL